MSNSLKKMQKKRSAEAKAKGPVREIRGEAQFEELVLGAQLPVVVDFWAPWCMPCRMMAPELERAAAEVEGEAVFVKVDTEQNPGLAGRYGISSIPSLLVFVNGEVADARVGVTRAQHLVTMARRARDTQRGGLLGKVRRAFGIGTEAAN